LVKGKFAYIAPEQAMGHQMDGRADLWSVGVILWELLSGRRLFKADNEAATLRATLRADVPSLAPLRPGITSELEGIVARALQRHASMRYATASEMRHDLLKCLRAIDSTPNASSIAAFMVANFASEIARQRELLVRVAKGLGETDQRRGVTSHEVLSYGNLDAVDSTARSVNTAKRAYFTTESRALSKRAWGAAAVAVCLIVACVTGGVVYSMRRSNGENEGVADKLIHRWQKPSLEPQIPRSDIDASKRETRSSEAFKSRQSAADNANQRIAQENGDTVRVLKTAVPQVKPVRSKGGVTSSAGNESARGYLTLDTTPWSNVTVLGKPIGQTPIIRYALPPGAYNLVLSNPELGIETSFLVRISENATTTKRVGLK
jgi:serine/threonine-protein kinase